MGNDNRDGSPHLGGAAEYASRYAVMEASNRRKDVILVVVLGVLALAVAGMAVLYKGTRDRVSVVQLGCGGTELRTTRLEMLTDASETMRRDTVQRFFRALFTASRDDRFQKHLTQTVFALTASGSEAHRSVEGFTKASLPARREAEVDAAVTAHPLSETRYRVDIVETANGQRVVRHAYAEIEVAVDAERDVDLNPWGVFLRRYSLDGALGGGA